MRGGGMSLLSTIASGRWTMAVASLVLNERSTPFLNLLTIIKVSIANLGSH